MPPPEFLQEGPLPKILINNYWDQHGEPTEFAIDYHGRKRGLSIERDFPES